MSWFRQIKILYSIRVLIFTYIIWIFIVDIIFGKFFNYSLFAISIGSSLVMQFLKSREFGIIKSLFVSTFLGGFAFGLFARAGWKDIVLSIIYYVFIGYLLYKVDDEVIDYSTYIYRAQRAVYALCALGLPLFFNHNDLLRHTVERFMIFYLIMVIATLRESREYKYKTRSVREIWGSIVVAAIVVIFSLDSVFNFIKDILFAIVRYLAGITSYTLLKPMGFIIYRIGYLLEALIGIIKSYLTGKPIIDNLVNKNQSNNVDMFKTLPEKNFRIPQNVQFIFGVFILLLIIYIVLKNMRYKNLERQTEAEEEIIEREKIIRTSEREKGGFSGFFKKLFYGNDTRKEILALYMDFEKRMSLKDIFKSHMTASQLSNIASLNLKDRNPLDRIANIYNETKFSNHEIKKQQLENMKSSLHEIKKEL